MGLVIDLTKAKNIGHDMRRAARAEEFAPHDAVIAIQYISSIKRIWRRRGIHASS